MLLDDLEHKRRAELDHPGATDPWKLALDPRCEGLGQASALHRLIVFAYVVGPFHRRTFWLFFLVT